MCHETMSPPTLSLPTMSHAVHMRPCLCRPPARPPSLLALAHALPSLPISLPSLSRFTSHWLSGGESSKMINSTELSENKNCLGARDFYFYCLGARYATHATRHRYIRIYGICRDSTTRNLFFYYSELLRIFEDSRVYQSASGL
jgi:hypothetical protein